MQHVIVHPPDTRPTLIVETCKLVTDSRIQVFRNDLFGRGCAHGVLFDRHQVVILRDTFGDVSADAIKEEARLKTEEVLAQAQGRTLDARVQDWLSRMTYSWNETLPKNRDAAGVLLHNVVPALAGASILAA